MQLNKQPILVADGAWNWNISPGTVLPGRGNLYLKSIKNYSPVESPSKPIIILDPHHYAPFFTISSPGPQQTARWFAGSSVNIEWQARNFEDHVTFSLQRLDQTGGGIRDIGLAWITKSGKTVVTLPGDLKPGPYQLIASNTKYGKRLYDRYRVMGGQRLVEIINPGKDSLPAQGTSFEIIKALYSESTGTVDVSIGVNAPKPFRFSSKGGPGGTQTLSYQLSNYELLLYPGHRYPVASGTISVTGNPSTFPKHVFAHGSSTNWLHFTPNLRKKLNAVTVRIYKNIVYGIQTGNLPDQYKTCPQDYYPKLELFVTTFLSNGKAIVSKRYTIYLKNVPGMSHRTEKLELENPLWNTFNCQSRW